MFGRFLHPCPDVGMGKAHPLEKQHRNQKYRNDAAEHGILICRHLPHHHFTDNPAWVNLTFWVKNSCGVAAVEGVILVCLGAEQILRAIHACADVERGFAGISGLTGS